MKVITIILAILTILAGFFCIIHPAFTAFSIAWILGFLLILGGINVLVSFFGKKEGSKSDVFFGILSIIGGIAMLCNYWFQIFTDVIIVAIVAGLILLMGILRISASIDLKKASQPWVLAMISGILSILIAIMAFINPLAGIVLIDYILSFIFIVQGISLLSFGISMKKN